MEKKDLVADFSRALYERTGALFVGSGISAGSNVSSWSDALADLARKKLGITVTEQDDLPLIAQFIVNRDYGNRGAIVAEFKRVFHHVFQLNSYHQALSWMNLKTIWTTNYDTLLEQAFAQSHFTVRVNDDNIAHPVHAAEIEIIKMHGCIDRSDQKDLVITREDYEDFAAKRPATVHRLQQDLLNLSFLFIGYSYSDSNVANVVTEARRLSGRATQVHYMLLRRDKKKDKDKQDLWAMDLRRSGIEVLIFDEFEELTDILYEIAKRSVGRTVYFTGSHVDSDPKNISFYREIGTKIAKEDRKANVETVVVDGQSTGVCRPIISAYTEEIIANKADIRRFIKLYPNPYAANPAFANDVALLPVLEQWRTPLMKSTQLVVAFDGGMGTETEVGLAKRYGCQILPVPRDPKGNAIKLFDDPKIHEFINTRNADYVNNAKACKLSSEDVVKCIRHILMG